MQIMKIKSLVTLALLFVLGFSIVHEFAFASYEHNHDSALEYVAELNAPANHGDICDTHFEYHQTFSLLEKVAFFQLKDSSLKIKTYKESYNFQINLNFLKPPIA